MCRKSKISISLSFFFSVSFFICSNLQAGTTANWEVKYYYYSPTGSWHTGSIDFIGDRDNPSDTECWDTPIIRKEYWLFPTPIDNVWSIYISIKRTDSSAHYYQIGAQYWDLDASPEYWHHNPDQSGHAHIWSDAVLYYFNEYEDQQEGIDYWYWDYGHGDNPTNMWNICYQYSSSGNTYERRYIVHPED